MDVSKSHDPLAPEGTDLSADAETPAEGDPQGAVSDPVHPDDASDVSAASADSEAQDAPPAEASPEDAAKIAEHGSPNDPEPSPFFEPTIASSAQAARDVGADALADAIEAGADPTSPAESAGPTEAETEAGEGEGEAEAQPVDEHGEQIPVPEPDAEAEVTPEPENPTTEGEAH